MFEIKTILTLIDMSDHSKVVLKGAMVVAKQFNARLLIYHASPNLHGEEQISKLRTDFEELINRLESDLNFHLSSSQVMVASEDFPSGQLLNQVVTDADLVVLGRPKSNSKGVKWNDISKVIDLCEQPVIIIPNGQKLNGIQQILYCSSYQDLNTNEPLDVIKSIASEFKSEVRIAHVKTHQSKPNKEHVERSRMEGAYFGADVRFSYKLIKNSDVIEGIGSYVKRKGDTDLVVIIRRKHHIFEQIFGKNYTFRMLQHTEVPLLILKEQQLN